MKKILAVALVALLGSGCKKKKPEEGIEPPQAPPAVGSATTGSAATSAKPLTAEEVSKRIDECWVLWSSAKYDAFGECFTPDATSETPGSGMPSATGLALVVQASKALRTAFPDMKGEVQLQLINGNNVASIALLSGVQDGPMTTPMATIAPTRNKVGLMIGQTIETDGVGHGKHEADYFDLGTILGQLKPSKDHPVRAAIDKLPMPRETVIAKNDATENANLTVAKATIDAYNKHDAKAFGESLADDSVWSEQPEPKDWDKKETVAQVSGLWKGFTDFKLTPTSMWAAGDYVVVAATMEGTNDGAVPEMGIKAKTGKKVSIPFLAIHKLDKGKITKTWVFDQSLAFEQQLGLVPPPPAAGSAAK